MLITLDNYFEYVNYSTLDNKPKAQVDRSQIS